MDYAHLSRDEQNFFDAIFRSFLPSVYIKPKYNTYIAKVIRRLKEKYPNEFETKINETMINFYREAKALYHEIEKEEWEKLTSYKKTELEKIYDSFYTNLLVGLEEIYE